MSTKFLTTLFEPWEKVCASESTMSTHLTPVQKLLEGSEYRNHNYYVINALTNRRADANVVSFRNFMLEFDDSDLVAQKELIKASKVPYTAMVYSGGKSIHLVISLVDPLPSELVYRALVDHLYTKFPTCDQKCKNPSRFSRMPGAMRDGVEQHLIELRNRVPNNMLIDWLGPLPAPKETARLVETGPNLGRIRKGFTNVFLGGGSGPGEWNSDLFLAALDLFKCGHTESEVIELVKDIHGYLKPSSLRTIRSARRNALKE